MRLAFSIFLIVNLANREALSELGAFSHRYHNPSITHLNGLSNLTSVEGDLVIGCGDLDDCFHTMSHSTSTNNPRLTGRTYNALLTDISGLINENDAIASLEGLDRLESVGGFLSIDDNPLLSSLSGLKRITSIDGALGISFNASLTQIDGFHQLTTAGSLAILYNASLTHLDELGNLTTLDSLDIIGNNSLMSLEGLSGLTASSRVMIHSNESLASCEASALAERLQVRCTFDGQAPEGISCTGFCECTGNNGTSSCD